MTESAVRPSRTLPAKANALQKQLAKFQGLPAAMRPGVVSFLLGQVVPMVGSAGLRFDEVTPQRVVVSIRNRRRVQNHIKGLHAAAMALLAETATGFCVGMNLPDDKLPLIKSMHIDYLRRAQGDMQAVAHLTADQIQQILTLEKGEVTVAVQITDSSGQTPIDAQMVWAWVPKSRKPG
jgi:acyl-coenzyme A thioesterase PaaI-like protein